MSDDRLDQLDYYTLLGVARDADVDAIKRAFRTFARRYHPDKFVGQAEEKIERATRIYRRGSEAVQTLTDLDARRAYDAGLAKGELRLRSEPRKQPAPARPEKTAAATISVRASPDEMFSTANGSPRPRREKLPLKA